MIFDVKTKAVCQIDVDYPEAFEMLCKTLEMDCVLDEDRDFYVVRDDYGDSRVCYTENGCEHTYDDRGELFLALRNVAVQVFPGFQATSVYIGEE
jgi:hypothetical protein